MRIEIDKISLAGVGVVFGMTISMSAIAPSAQAVTFSGTTVGGSTWNRPLENLSALDATATAVRYSVYNFTVATTGNYQFLSQANTPTNWDNYGFLYVNSFNPNTPLLNAVVGNDDLGTIGRSGFTAGLTAGKNYFFVTTGYLNSSAGTFTNSYDLLASTPTAVPEPATILGSLTALGYGVYKRRKLQGQQEQSIDKEVV